MLLAEKVYLRMSAYNSNITRMHKTSSPSPSLQQPNPGRARPLSGSGLFIGSGMAYVDSRLDAALDYSWSLPLGTRMRSEYTASGGRRDREIESRLVDGKHCASAWPTHVRVTQLLPHFRRTD